MDKFIALLFLIVAIGFFLNHEKEVSFKKGVAVTQALDQKEGEIWVDQQLAAEKTKVSSVGKEQINASISH